MQHSSSPPSFICSIIYGSTKIEVTGTVQAIKEKDGDELEGTKLKVDHRDSSGNQREGWRRTWRNQTKGKITGTIQAIKEKGEMNSKRTKLKVRSRLVQAMKKKDEMNSMEQN